MALLPTHTRVEVPVTVIHAAEPGPRIWLSAALHGDEINGVEIIRRVLGKLEDKVLRGTVVAVPIVNVFGFMGQSRYLPDRRDLNRSFPGSPRGSLASRMANFFMQEVVSRCTHGIDLHTGSSDRFNFPQIRGDLSDPETLRCARAFGAPVILQSTLRDGSLRFAAAKRRIPVIVYEAGEASRFDEASIRLGVKGVLGVLRELGLLARRNARPVRIVRIDDSSWVRARRAGVLRLTAKEGDAIKRGQVLGIIADPLGMDGVSVVAPFDGIIVGLTRNPIVHGGDAVVHVGRTKEQLPEI
ncbi:MAG: M14 family metallopeptidase [Planctomycetota bacterium]